MTDLFLFPFKNIQTFLVDLFPGDENLPRVPGLQEIIFKYQAYRN
ncbi:hypothetical protein P872_19675 [Rhodonellum psychrophilum GCM71 = DSM 17998]|uniref:Uncharacterized protein n=2 Tax=Rhodonellum TaxID=336827 RepID=U5BVY3_9BACT|nr:hypothetical protein P872_19675 [Rhodonellum psychrophilum GCM71 = DSM 17998]SDY83924.1 hypothetical protein SAMN05444412_10398 [Rhodonellum ikkaensis]